MSLPAPRIPLAPGPGVHPIYVRLLNQLLVQRGINLAAVHAEAELAPESIAGDHALPFDQVQRLIIAALRRSDCPWLGLELGARIQAHMHGIVGAAALSSGTLDAALRTVARFAALRFSATRIELSRGAVRTGLALIPLVDAGDARRFVDDALLVVIDQFIQLLTGGRPDSLRYELPAGRVDAAMHYARVLGGSIHCGRCAHAGLSLANADIDRQCLGADAQAHALATHALERALAETGATSALKPRILALLATVPAPWPTAHALARQLHLSPRTLHRRLAAENTSFRALVDVHRREQAQRLLRDGIQPIERIAELLGYADPSNFGRSCRRWFGCSPREFRRRAGGA